MWIARDNYGLWLFVNKPTKTIINGDKYFIKRDNISAENCLIKKKYMSRKNWIAFKKGTNRTVLLIGDYAVKTPVLTNGHLLFLHGCYANYKERAYCKMMKNVENNKFYDLVAPSIFCLLFGLFQVQKRCDEVLFEMTEEQLSRFDTVRGGESKKQNFGFYEGRLVCLDYGD